MSLPNNLLFLFLFRLHLYQRRRLNPPKFNPLLTTSTSHPPPPLTTRTRATTGGPTLRVRSP